MRTKGWWLGLCLLLVHCGGGASGSQARGDASATDGSGDASTADGSLTDGGDASAADASPTDGGDANTADGGGPVLPRVSVSRTSAVGPALVFFDASATTDVDSAACPSCDPFRDLRYSWNFGDPGATWKYGTRTGNGSANVAYGPEVAHVFDPPLGSGTKQYRVTVTITDGTNTVTNYAVATVRVTDADSAPAFSGTKTTCISGSGNFTGCPAAAAHVTNGSYSASLGSAITAPHRYLFHCGETFTSSAQVNLNSAGPGLIGSYDCATHSKPVVTPTTTRLNAVLLGATAEDWRLMGLDFEGGSIGISGISAVGSSAVKNILEYDDVFTNAPSMFTNDVNSEPQWLGVVGNVVNNTTGEAIFSWGHNVAILGNDFNGGGNGGILNLVRTMGIEHSVISDNSLSGVTSPRGQGGSAITFRTSPKPNPPVAGHSVISDNVVSSGDNYDGIDTEQANPSVSLGITELIVERNWIQIDSTTNAQVGVKLEDCAHCDTRDNVVDLTGAAGYVGVWYANDKQPSTSPRVFNNSIYTGDSSGLSFRGIWLESSASNAEVENNIAYAPALTGGLYMIAVSGATGLTESNNTCGSGATHGCAGKLTTDPFTSVSPFNPTNARPDSGSYAAGAGARVPVWADFFGVRWPPSWSLGAVHP